MWLLMDYTNFNDKQNVEFDEIKKFSFLRFVYCHQSNKDHSLFLHQSTKCRSRSRFRHILARIQKSTLQQSRRLNMNIVMWSKISLKNKPSAINEWKLCMLRFKAEFQNQKSISSVFVNSVIVVEVISTLYVNNYVLFKRCRSKYFFQRKLFLSTIWVLFTLFSEYCLALSKKKERSSFAAYDFPWFLFTNIHNFSRSLVLSFGIG